MICNFEQRLNACSVDEFKKLPYTKDFNYYELSYIFQWAELIGPIISFPIVSVLGFLLNLLAILVLTNKRNKAEKLFDLKIFKYILINAAFNCLECFLVTFRLLNECMGVNSIYCSTVRYNIAVKYFRIIVTGYVSEVLKTCSIFMSLFFSLERYIQTSKTESRFLKRFADINLKVLVPVVIGVSALTSVSIIFGLSVQLDR